MSSDGTRVVEVKAVALSVDLRGVDSMVTLGTGTAIKKDVVIVKVRTEDGIVGYGEAHHALAPLVVASMNDLPRTSAPAVWVGAPGRLLRRYHADRWRTLAA